MKVTKLIRGILAIMAMGFVAFAAQPAMAQFPDHQITVVVPFGAGGGNDAYGRLIAQGLQEHYGQPVIVQNIGGGGSLIGSAEVAAAAPDGYTLLSTSDSLLSGQAMRANPPFSLDALQPIAQYSVIPGVVVVNNDMPVTTFAELVEYSKTNPLNYASSGVGGGMHLNTEALMQTTGLLAAHVPYGGGGETIPATVGGETQVMLIDFGAAKDAIENGQLRVVGMAAQERHPELPDVPTLREQGFDFDYAVVHGLYAPAGLPSDLLSELNTVVNEIVAGDRFRTFLEGRGGQIVQGSPKDFAATNSATMDTMNALIDTLGIARQ